MLIVAHRTMPLDAPENSVEGIRLAGALGADVVEVDVRRRCDGTPVLAHDGWLGRLVRRQPATTTLAEALVELPGGLGIALDVKDPGGVPATVEVLDRHGGRGRALLWSAHAGAVADAARLAPDVPRAYLRNTEREAEALAYLDDAVAMGATAVSVMDASVTSGVVARGRELGLTVFAWVRTLAAQPRVLACDPDGVVTDWVAEAREQLDR